MNHELQDIGFEFSSLLDTEFLSKNYGKNFELARSIFQSFLNSTSAELEQLNKDIEENNYEGIASISHKIKSNFMYVGTPILNGKLDKLEKAAKEKSNAIGIFYAAFQSEFEILFPIIKEEYARLDEYLNK